MSAGLAEGADELRRRERRIDREEDADVVLGGAEAGEACESPACRAARRHGHADMKKMKEPWEVLDATRFISAAG